MSPLLRLGLTRLKKFPSPYGESNYKLEVIQDCSIKKFMSFRPLTGKAIINDFILFLAAISFLVSVPLRGKQL